MTPTYLLPWFERQPLKKKADIFGKEFPKESTYIRREDYLEILGQLEKELIQMWRESANAFKDHVYHRYN